MKTKTEAKKSKEQTFGSPSLPNNQTDASRLVGGIVEKGFSGQPLKAPSAPPRPTVLPFPVARHRSHGPLWDPVDHGSDRSNDGGEDDDEDNDFEQLMAFANPIKRKEKKGLDLARWQDASSNNKIDNNQVINGKKQSKASMQVGISDGMDKPTGSSKDDAELSRIPTLDKTDVADEYPSALKEFNEKKVDMDMERENPRTSPSRHYMDLEYASPEETWSEGATTETKEINLRETCQGSSEMDNVMHQVLRNDLVSGSDSLSMVDEHGASSLEAQIDAENLARLENMTAGEIAEAQSEIMEKLSPGLLNVLKKRGQGKSKGKMNIESITVNDGKVCQPNSDSNSVNASLDDGTAKKKMKKDSTSTQSQVHRSDPHLWSSWSTRVEAVRQLRFSLNGNIMEFDFAQSPLNGSVSAQNGYGVENVSERDFLRTEGDPSGIGYTIKEAASLTRSVVPGQRAIALHLIGTILDKAIHGILQNKVGCTLQLAEAGVPDWEAIWAFVLGPEPELALTLRLSLDDNHDSVVSACVKVIQSVLSFGANETFFNTSKKIPAIPDDLPTAAVFRSKPQIDTGFLGGGFWKYSAKPSNILPLASKTEDENTIQDDVVVASQDIVAGLVRMGILTRIQYLLETEPSASLEEGLLSILIAIARHSPKCATAIMMCNRLVQIVVNRFTLNEPMKIGHAKIKSVILLKLLAQTERNNCAEFVRSGTLHKVTWHLCRDVSLEKWMKSGKEVCGLSALLLVELLQLSRVCIMYGYCVSYFADLFPALRIWLDVPAFEKLVSDGLVNEFSAISKEAYLFIEALAKRLPNFYLPSQHNADAGATEMELWSWTYVGGLIDIALQWSAVKKNSYLSKYFDSQNIEERCIMLQDTTVSSLLLVISSVMHMLSAVLEAVLPVDVISGYLPWLPEFVPRIGLNLINNIFSCYTPVNGSDKDSIFPGIGSFLEFMCHLRRSGGQEASIAATSCLQSLVQVAGFIDKLIQLAKPEHKNMSPHRSKEADVLTNGIIRSCLSELDDILTTSIKYALDWQSVQSVEIFGRGGPAPGVGVGWGASGGGFWSTNLLLAQLDARLITCLLGILPRKDSFSVEQARSCIRRLSSALEICQIAGPRERSLLDRLFDFIFEAPMLKCLDLCIQQYLHLNSGLKTFGLKHEENEYIMFSSILASHFKRRWLSTKKSSKHKPESLPITKNKSKGIALDTIHEEIEPSNTGMEVNTSLAQEWAHQKLPLPNHWFLSSISVTYSLAGSEAIDELDKENLVEVGQAGLFFLLGLEALHVVIPPDLCYVVKNVPVVWKIHALSVMLIDGLGILESKKCRDTYGVLQSIYGQLIDESKLAADSKVLNFKSEVHESYCTFIEIIVEQFAAVSYGDVLFGRQVAIYLHRYVEASVKLATWNALSNTRTLELLPCLKECLAEAHGYLEPVEDDEKMLEAYVKSWVSGALDKAASRESMSYTLALHHVACFLFGDCIDDKISLRNQLVKSLLRDFAHKSHHKGMMMKLMKYKKPSSTQQGFGVVELQDRIGVMKEACEGNVSLLNHVENLKLLLH